MADYDILAFSEAWLDPSIRSEEFLSKDVYKDRSSTSIAQTASRGGGVLIAIRNNILCVEYTNDIMLDIEAVCVRIPLKTGNVYRPLISILIAAMSNLFKN